MVDTKVLARHKLTGKIQEVPPIYIDMFPAFEGVTEKQLASIRREAEIDLYGVPVEDKELSEVLDPTPTPDSTWLKDDLVAYADEHGIAHDSTATKAEILAAINDAQEGA